MFRKQKSHPNEISMLRIKIELMQSELVPETLERVGREMKSFEQYCKELKKEQPATHVGYSFTGITLIGLGIFIQLETMNTRTRTKYKIDLIEINALEKIFCML